MALTSWKSFKFFDSTLVAYPDKDTSDLFSQEFNCICSGSDSLFVGCIDGTVRILSRAFKVIRSFKASDSGPISYIRQVEGTSFLVTVAEDLSSEPQLKVWALDKVDKKTGVPRCQSTLGIHNTQKQFPISAFAALNDLSQLAIGFANGAVTVIRGDLIHDRGTKQRTVFESEEPITGIQFRDNNTTTLYIATTARILTLIISGRGQGQAARTLEDKGCAVGCMTTDKSTRDIIVAREDAIYYYGLHGRGACYNCDGQKAMLTSYRDYVSLVLPAQSQSVAKFALRAIGNNQTFDLFNSATFAILNTDFHFVAHSEAFPSQAKAMFAEWGDLFILTHDGKLLRLHEKPLPQRLEILFQRDLHVLAIQIAQKAGADTELQNMIFRKYGDYLYQKKDYDTAMQQYLRAIDNTEPSHIIRKFLDTQRIHNLVDYLEELHEHKRATSDHIILLLNCYAKLKDVKKLEAFIKSPEDLNFDIDTAITMCRQAGYSDQAAYLARRHSEHDLVVSILIEDLKKYAEAMAYIWRLEPSDAYRSFTRYATVLLEYYPEDTTKIFTDYYTGNFRPKKDAIVVAPQAQSPPPGTLAQGAGLATSAVQNLAALLPLPYMSVHNTDVSTSLADDPNQTRIIESESNDSPPKYDVPKPRTAFSAFIDHPHEFVRFLEACIASNVLGEDDQVDIYTALFEMYLRQANDSKDSERIEWERRAKSLVEKEAIPIDISNVLLLSHLERFRDGTILVKEQQGLRFDIFRSYTTANDTAGAIKALKKYGPEEPQLYPAALAYFTSTSQILEEAGSEVDVVLKKIDDDGLMAPLQVIQTLSTNGVASMGLVKKYLLNTISKERLEIERNRRTASTLQNDTISKRAELDQLTSKPSVFNTSRCDSCGMALDLPTVHFSCKHSFHQRCLNVTDGGSIDTVECPRCAPQNATIRAIKKAQEESRQSHDLFKSSLSRSSDRFGTITEWFGRGVMASSPVTD